MRDTWIKLVTLAVMAGVAEVTLHELLPPRYSQSKFWVTGIPIHFSKVTTVTHVTLL